MATLSEGARQEIWRKLMKQWSKDRTPTSLLAVEVKAAVDAVDQWIDDNAVSYNNALPAAARAAMSAGEKARLLSMVALARFTGGA